MILTPIRTIIGAGAPAYIANAVNFDGTNDWLDEQASVDMGASSKFVSLSLWLKMASVSDSFAWLFAGTDATSDRINIRVNGTTEVFAFYAYSSAPGIVVWGTGSADIADGAWHHIAAHADLTNAANRGIWIDGIEDGSVNWSDYVNTDIDWAGIDKIFVGSNQHASPPQYPENSDYADFWLDNTYVDFSDAGVRVKFIDSNGKPVDLGATGAKPTGTAPKVYLSGATANWHTNKGTAGGFTENGELTTASTSPSD